MEKITMNVGGKELTLETGRMARQANGAILATYGGSAVLATACCSSSVTEGLDFVPLQVEYNEKYYAAGKIPGGFLKREGRAKNKEILVSRLIDRPMRPLFHKEFGREIQVIPTVVSADQINPPDMLAVIAASAAVTISDIPFEGPVGGLRVAYVNDEFVVNPTFDQIQESIMDIVVAGTEEGITMVEGGAKEVSEDLMLQAIEIAETTIKEMCQVQRKLAELVGKEKLPMATIPAKLENEAEITEFLAPKLAEACFVLGKKARYAAIDEVKAEAKAKFIAEDADEDTLKMFSKLAGSIEKNVVRQSILKNNKRTDGRSTTDIRNITCEVGILERTHGSSLFTRGETQSLGVVTLGTVSDEQMQDDIDGDLKYEHFMLHYNFPPFSVGETGRLGTGRREIGHGHLAQRALEGVLPTKLDFPYTIRIVSEVLESNGSSSMATVCSGSLSMLSAGVPIKAPVAGIAMGLISEGDDYVILSDILGEEDHLGDMDFKVAGTEKGITAFQMDIKISNVSRELMQNALKQAYDGRMHILGIMNQTIATPNSDVSKYAPKIVAFNVPQDKIGMIIGPGGKTIQSITEKTKATVNIDNDGKVTVSGKNSESAEMACNLIKGMIAEPEVGKTYKGVVKKITEFGAFIEIFPGKEGLCHISKLSKERVQKVEDVLQINQVIQVKLIEIDRMGRINFSYVDAEQ
ncbi:MAG: polyribonucleotide nucleotidyltransferase [Spirochaetales bacterium]|nr:polyribonucleotide nucleotidyltransferase [Spirochaetales bacterium]